MSKVFVTALFVSAIAISSGLDCSNVVWKESQGLLNWLGNISFVAPVSTGPSGWALDLTFDQNFTGVGVWDGFVSYNGWERWAEIVNRDADDAAISVGLTKSLRFRINYGLDIPVPNLVSLRFQDIELCRG